MRPGYRAGREANPHEIERYDYRAAWHGMAFNYLTGSDKINFVADNLGKTVFTERKAKLLVLASIFTACPRQSVISLACELQDQIANQNKPTLHCHALASQIVMESPAMTLFERNMAQLCFVLDVNNTTGILRAILIHATKLDPKPIVDCIIGNPWYPVFGHAAICSHCKRPDDDCPVCLGLSAEFVNRIQQRWLDANDGRVRKIADVIRRERAFYNMPILGDALEEAGCEDSDILDHCRLDTAPHHPGCFVLDGLRQLE